MDRNSLDKAKEKRSQIMRTVRSKGNKTTELVVAKILREIGIKYWSSHSAGIKGKPDFIFRKKRIVIFVDGCFWHGCRKCYRRPKTSQEYWDAKISRNIHRDKTVRGALRMEGWEVISLKEHQLKNLSIVKLRLKKSLTS